MLDHYVGMQAPERKLSMCTRYGLEHGLCRGKTNGQEQKLKSAKVSGGREFKAAVLQSWAKMSGTPTCNVLEA